MESDDRGMTRRVSSCFLTPKTFVRSLKVSWSQKSLTFAIKPLVRLAVWKIVSHLRENWMLCLLRERTSDSCTPNAERCTFNQTKGPVGSVFFFRKEVCCLLWIRRCWQDSSWLWMASSLMVTLRSGRSGRSQSTLSTVFWIVKWGTWQQTMTGQVTEWTWQNRAQHRDAQQCQGAAQD